MDDFLLTLSFSAVSLVTAAFFALITSPLGATLSLRNEILLGIALPPLGSSVIAGAMFLGVSPDATVLLSLLAAISIFLVMVLLPLNAGKNKISMRRRELILAGLFCIGNMLTMLFMALSPMVESHFKNLLQGEILAITTSDGIVTAILSCIIIAVGIKYRGYVYAYALDEEGLKIKEKQYTRITILYRAISTLIITGGIILIGPLLTTSLLVVPAFCIERSCKGLDMFMGAVAFMAVTGTVGGFLVAIVTDLPPAPVAVCGIFCTGFAIYLVRRRSA